MGEVARVAMAARVFTITALTSVAAVAGASNLRGALLLVGIALATVSLALFRRMPMGLVALLEGCVTAVVAVLVPDTHTSVVPYLVVPVLIGALDHGLRGMLRVLLAEVGALGLAWWMVRDLWDRDAAATEITWLATAVGIGLMGAALRGAISASEEESSYRAAVGLIRRLQALTSRLSGGLDSVAIAEQVIDAAERYVAADRCVVFSSAPLATPTQDIVPLRCTPGPEPAPAGWAMDLAHRCWVQRGEVTAGPWRAVPLVADDDRVGVLVVETRSSIDEHALEALRSTLRPLSLQLKAGLLFDRVRDTAASQERQRIAREVHDGVAQDVASLGYLVDNLVGDDAGDEQRARVAQLRGELSRIVTDLRHSIFDLRQVVRPEVGLGESLSALARQVGSTSAMTVHVTMEENGPRLPSAVEHQLLRIAQEAMTNARKHSGATNLWVSCTVRAPYARIEVLDDGSRSHTPRADSHGFAIMRERADAIGALLAVEEPSVGTGTRVTVTLGLTASAVEMDLRPEARHGVLELR